MRKVKLDSSGKIGIFHGWCGENNLCGMIELEGGKLYKVHHTNFVFLSNPETQPTIVTKGKQCKC